MRMQYVSICIGMCFAASKADAMTALKDKNQNCAHDITVEAAHCHIHSHSALSSYMANKRSAEPHQKGITTAHASIVSHNMYMP